MQNNISKLNIFLIIAIVILFGLLIYTRYGKTGVEQLVTDGVSDSHVVNDENFATEIKWATAADGMPVGWVKWTDTMIEIPVDKFGPSKEGDSYMIKLHSKLVDGIMGEKVCIGDAETSLCAVGNHPEVIRYFNIISYRD